jgi:hypothetical protein
MARSTKALDKALDKALQESAITLCDKTNIAWDHSGAAARSRTIHEPAA